MKFFSYFALFVFLSSPQFFSKDDETFNDWLPKMYEIFGEQPVKCDITNAEVRELKYPGQRFQHLVTTNIEGDGKSISKNKFWWPTEKRLHLQHETSFMLLEEITSNEEDLDQGIIKSKFTVQFFNENLKSAEGSVKWGVVSSNEIFKSLVALGEKYGEAISRFGEGLMGSGLLALTAPEPAISKIYATASIIGGSALRVFSWFLVDKLPGEVDEDGNTILSRDAVEKYFPECSKVISKLHKLEGTTIRTTWEPNKGYTRFEISEIDGIDYEDKERIAKIVYRFNPVGVSTILPKDKKGKEDVWAIDVEKDLGAILVTTGIDFDNLEGYVWVKDCGTGVEEFEDEMFLTHRPTDTTTLRTSNAYDNSIIFKKKFKDHSLYRVHARPTAKIVVVTPKEEDNVPRYVKKIDMEGKLENRIDKPAGLLTKIKFEEQTVRLHTTYTQIRMKTTRRE